MNAGKYVAVRYADGVTTTVDVSSIEAEASRRALSFFKRLWSEAEIEARLESLIAESDEFFRQALARSDGNFRKSVVELTVEGISAEEFARWWRSGAMSDVAFLDMHPEHYLFRTVSLVSGTTLQFVERFWGHVTRVYVDILERPTMAIDPALDPVLVHAARLRLADGTEIADSIHQYGNAGNGAMLARYEVMVPVALPVELQAESEQHLLYEVTLWFDLAKAYSLKMAGGAS